LNEERTIIALPDDGGLTTFVVRGDAIALAATEVVFIRFGRKGRETGVLAGLEVIIPGEGDEGAAKPLKDGNEAAWEIEGMDKDKRNMADIRKIVVFLPTVYSSFSYFSVYHRNL
jgi:hypothetical protein